MTLPTIDLWLIATLAAAAFQALRFMLQKVLATATLTASGATFARFFYSAPLVALGLAAYLAVHGLEMPALSVVFWVFGLTGGLAQVLATVCVVQLFKSRNFAVGITLKKTETILSVLVGLVLLGEGVSLFAFGAIALGVCGVILLSKQPQSARHGWRSMANQSVALGLGAGFLFAISAVCYRGASLELATDDAVLRAAVTLSAVTASQLVGMALWLKWRSPGQILAVWQARRIAIWIGILSMGGSFCWFLAFTLQTAALVKAVGQVELVFSLLISTLIFGERSTGRELWGIGLLVASIVALVLFV